MLKWDKWEESETAYSIMWQIVYKDCERPKGTDSKGQKSKREEKRARKRWERGQKGSEWGEKKGSTMVIFYSRQQACGLAGTPGVSLLESFLLRGAVRPKKKKKKKGAGSDQSYLPFVLTKGYGSIKHYTSPSLDNQSICKHRFMCTQEYLMCRYSIILYVTHTVYHKASWHMYDGWQASGTYESKTSKYSMSKQSASMNLWCDNHRISHHMAPQ